jgi:cyclohexyl-isocyanide hydratase
MLDRGRPRDLSVGMVLFPNLTLLDMAGPYEVLTNLPGAKVYLIAASLEPLRTAKGLAILPDTTFEDAPPFDMLLIPGGPGQMQAMEDQRLLDFVRERGKTARYVTSVCTGSLVLGAAGLLQGYRATTHWAYLDLLKPLGAEPVAERVVIDGNRMTSAGVSAGIDFALMLAATLYGGEVAREIQLMIEYDPAPPFKAGSPKSADAALLQRATARLATVYQQRREQVERIAQNLEKV